MRDHSGIPSFDPLLQVRENPFQLVQTRIADDQLASPPLAFLIDADRRADPVAKLPFQHERIGVLFSGRFLLRGGFWRDRTRASVARTDSCFVATTRASRSWSRGSRVSNARA